jgi:hypothetical protein
MNVYLACTVRGSRQGTAAARVLCEALERRGHTVLTKHLLADDVDRAESSLSEAQVFRRDIEWLESADLLIAESSGSSFGVGFEVGYVIGRSAGTGQRVLVLYDKARRGAVSRLMIGNVHPACTTYAYRDEDDLRRFVEEYLAPCPQR